MMLSCGYVCSESNDWCHKNCVVMGNVRSMNQGKLHMVKKDGKIECWQIRNQWIKMGRIGKLNKFIFYCGQESLKRNGVALIVNKRVWNAVLEYSLKNDRIISIHAQGTEGCRKDCLCGSHSIQTVTDQLLYSPTVSNASPLSQTVTPIWGSDPCFGFPTAQVQQGQSWSPSLLFFSPRLSYQVLRGSMYSFLVIRVSCLLSAGVLQDLLHLKMYSWCIHGERCAPRPPTPVPSWLLSAKYFKILFSTFLIKSPNITF